MREAQHLHMASRLIMYGERWSVYNGFDSQNSTFRVTSPRISRLHVYTMQPVIKPLEQPVEQPRLHRVNKHPTGCQTGCTTSC